MSGLASIDCRLKIFMPILKMAKLLQCSPVKCYRRPATFFIFLYIGNLATGGHVLLLPQSRELWAEN